jgi:hypothetical protein
MPFPGMNGICMLLWLWKAVRRMKTDPSVRDLFNFLLRHYGGVPGRLW